MSPARWLVLVVVAMGIGALDPTAALVLLVGLSAGAFVLGAVPDTRSNGGGGR